MSTPPRLRDDEDDVVDLEATTDETPRSPPPTMRSAPPPAAPLACSVCGCTEERACEGGCAWVRVRLVERGVVLETVDGGDFYGAPLCNKCLGPIFAASPKMLEVLLLLVANGVPADERCQRPFELAREILAWVKS